MADDDVDERQRELARLKRDLQIVEAHAAIAQQQLLKRRLEAEGETLSRPWWRSRNLAALVGILASVTPVTVAIQGCIERVKQRCPAWYDAWVERLT